MHRYVSDAFTGLTLDRHIDQMQFPVNIRLQNGTIDPRLDSRPRASTKARTDLWSGNPTSIMVILAVLGDTDEVGIRFLEPGEFPEAYLRTLDDYTEGQPVVDMATECPIRFSHDGFFLVDQYLLHQTVKSEHGLRLSLDFHFIPRRRVASDRPADCARRRYFMPLNEWREIGRGRLMTTDEPMASFTGVDRPAVGYAVDLHMSALEYGAADIG